MAFLHNLLPATVFHLFLFLIAAGGHGPLIFHNYLALGTIMQAACVILFYLMIVVATQVPHLLFFNPNLNSWSRIDRQPLGRVRFYVSSFAFWVFVFLAFYFQLIQLDSTDIASKITGKYVLLLSLAIFYSAQDYAIPSYQRHVELSERGDWGSKAMVMV